MAIEVNKHGEKGWHAICSNCGCEFTQEEIMQKETEYFGEGEFAAVRDGRLMMYPYEEGRWKIIGSVSSASTPRMITSKNACIWEKLPSYNSFSEEYLKEKTAEQKVRKNGNKNN